jgi:CpeT protein
MRRGLGRRRPMRHNRAMRNLLCLSCLMAIATLIRADPSTTPSDNVTNNANDPTSATTRPAEAAPSLNHLADRLTGHFSSLKQSQHHAGYFDIHLHARRIWTDRNDGPWIYLEQARSDALDQPYRQRVYHLSIEEGVYKSDVYELPNVMPGEPNEFVGGWKDVAVFAALTPQQLTRKDGCTVHLTWENGTYVGGTRGQACTSQMRGATHATSEVVIGADGMRTWDRGYNAFGKQVWGATEGAYIFDRVNE